MADQTLDGKEPSPGLPPRREETGWLRVAGRAGSRAHSCASQTNTVASALLRRTVGAKHQAVIRALEKGVSVLCISPWGFCPILPT